MMRTKLGIQTAFAAALCAGMLSGVALSIAANVPAIRQSTEDDTQIANSLATMLRAARTVISRNQARINDPNIADKGLDAEAVLAESSKIYQATMKIDPHTIDPKTRHGKLIRMQMDSIAEVMDGHQRTINRQGVGFKGFIPAVFARLVNEAFARRAAGNAEMKVTAPSQLIRNARARPDKWEATVISDKLLAPSWPKNQPFAEIAPNRDKPAFRIAVPEYYGSSCLTCHGSPKGDIDVTGYPKDGAKEGDLGGVISITLYR